MGSCCSSPEDDQQEGFNSLPATGADGINKPLPPGWKMVPSRSRPGKVSYQNIHTGERISWFPTEEAKTFKGGITKVKRKKKKKRGDEGSNNGGGATTAGSEQVKLSESGGEANGQAASVEVV